MRQGTSVGKPMKLEEWLNGNTAAYSEDEDGGESLLVAPLTASVDNAPEHKHDAEIITTHAADIGEASSDTLRGLPARSSDIPILIVHADNAEQPDVPSGFLRAADDAPEHKHDAEDEGTPHADADPADDIGEASSDTLRLLPGDTLHGITGVPSDIPILIVHADDAEQPYDTMLGLPESADDVPEHKRDAEISTTHAADIGEAAESAKRMQSESAEPTQCVDSIHAVNAETEKSEAASDDAENTQIEPAETTQRGDGIHAVDIVTEKPNEAAESAESTQHVDDAQLGDVQVSDEELYDELPDDEVSFDDYLPEVDIEQDNVTDEDAPAAENETPSADDNDNIVAGSPDDYDISGTLDGLSSGSYDSNLKSDDGLFSGFLHAAMSEEVLRNHDSRYDRDIRFSQKLHEVIRVRKDKAARLRDEENAARAAQKRRQTVLSIMLLLLLAAAVAFIALKYISSRSLESMLDAGDSMYRDGNYSAAQAVYNDAHRRYPDSAEALTGLARASAMAGEADAAGRAWLRYLDTIPPEDNAGRAQALYELAQIHVKLGKPAEAISTLIKATQLSPNYDVYMMLGHMLEEDGRVQDALRAYSMAMELRTMLPENRRGAAAEARSAAVRVLSLIVAASDARRELNIAFENRVEAGTIALNLGRWDDAAACFADAMSISEEDERPWLGLSIAYASLERHSDAVKIMRDASKRFPDSATVSVRADELNGISDTLRRPAGGKRH